MKTISKMWFRARRSVLKLIEDCNGVAAIEFAMVVPIMLVLFFGTIEFSTGVAMSRKVTLMTRTLSDLTSQSLTVADTDLTNFFTASNAIMTPYPYTPTVSTVSELYVDPVTLQARVEWSRSATFVSGAVVLGAGHAVRFPVAIPTQIAVGGSYLIYSEVKYPYTPIVTFSMAKTLPTFTLSDIAYTRPRQSQCVIYPTPAPGTTVPCPVL